MAVSCNIGHDLKISPDTKHTVGVNVYVIKGIAPKVPIERIFRGTLPFIVAMVILLVGIISFPDLVLWFPNLLNP